VVEQQRFRCDLEEIHEAIEAANVRQLVSDDASICSSVKPVSALTGSSTTDGTIPAPLERPADGTRNTG